MRVVFLCSSLEPGRDGVGDYTRSLALECIRLGHAAAVMALNDRRLAGSISETTEDGGLRCLRLSDRLSWSERVRRASAFVAQNDPDCVSLQFVGYGFQRKGIVAGLAPRLRAITGSRPAHVMMHELWAGGTSLKMRITGAVQRHFALRMLRRLRPVLIHTSLPVCVDTLANAGIRSELLPIFGNIPVAEMDGSEDPRATVRSDGAWVGGFFGSLYHEWNPAPLMRVLLDVAKQKNVRLRLVSIGRLGADDEKKWAAFSAEYAPLVQFIRLGEQPSRRVSQAMQFFDFGIASASWRVLGKSGAAAAMLDHGLPVVVLPDPVTGFSGDLVVAGDPALVHRCDDTLEARLLAGLQKMPPSASVTKVAKQFIAGISAALAGRVSG